jgi:hypothetical protein
MNGTRESVRYSYYYNKLQEIKRVATLYITGMSIVERITESQI